MFKLTSDNNFLTFLGLLIISNDLPQQVNTASLVVLVSNICKNNLIATFWGLIGFKLATGQWVNSIFKR